MNTPFGAIVPDAAKRSILDVRDQLTADKYPLYRGPIRDNKGNTVVPAGRTVPNSDNDFKVKMDFLVEGTIGETGLKKS